MWFMFCYGLFRKYFLEENEVPLSTENLKKFVVAICCRLKKETKLSIENKALEQQGRLAKVCFYEDDDKIYALLNSLII